MSDDVKVTISADDKPLKEAFDRATKHVNDFGRSASEAINKASGYAGTMSNLFAGGVTPAIQETNKATIEAGQSMSVFSATTLGVAAGQFAFNILQRSIDFVKSSITESIGAFSDQEEAINKLKQAFVITGGASESAVDGVNAFATSLESASKFSDDAIIRQVAFVKSLGATTQASKDLVLAAANLSATIGGSLEENTDKLSKTLSGTAGRLAQYIPELNSLTDAQLKAGDAARIINDKFGGSAANDLKTYAGSVEALKNSFNNLQETLGESIAKSSIFEGAIKSIKDVLDENNNAIAANKITFESASGGQAVASKTSQQLAIDYGILNKEIENLTKSLEEQANRSSLSKFFFDDDTSSVIKKQIDDAKSVRDAIEEKLTYSKQSVAKEEIEKAAPVVRDRTAIDNELALKAELKAINEQSAIEEKTFKDMLYAQGQTEQFARKELEMQALFEGEAAKLEAVTQVELQKTNVIKDEQEKRAAREKIMGDAQLKAIKLQNGKELAEKQLLSDRQKAIDNANLSATGNFLQAGIMLAKEGSAVQKGLMMTQAIINTYAGATRAYAETPFPASIAVSASIVALGLANVAKISGAKFEQGGIVPGLNQFGDNVQVRVNPGEMILNNTQQKELLNVANGRSNSNDNGALASLVDAIRNQVNVIQIDGREIARVVRDQRASGFAI